MLKQKSKNYGPLRTVISGKMWGPSHSQVCPLGCLASGLQNATNTHLMIQIIVISYCSRKQHFPLSTYIYTPHWLKYPTVGILKYILSGNWINKAWMNSQMYASTKFCHSSKWFQDLQSNNGQWVKLVYKQFTNLLLVKSLCIPITTGKAYLIWAWSCFIIIQQN
jgi:hypothetical protein